MADASKAMGKAGGGSDLGEIARAALRWWLDELRACVPNALKARAGAAPAAFACLLLGDGRVALAPFDRARPVLPGEREAAEPSEALAARFAAMAREAGRSGRGVRLCVPVSLCLARRTRIPARALSHAGALLRHEAEGLIPLPPGDILSDWYVETEDAETRELDLVQVVLARPRIAEVEALLAAAGLRVTQLTVGEGEGRAMPVDLVGGRDPSLRAYLKRLPFTAKLMLALAAALFAAMPAVVASGQSAALETSEAMRAAALRSSPAAVSAQAVADALEAIERAPRASALLDAVAARLPAGTRLSRFQLGAGQIVLGIEGGETGALLTALSGLPGTAAVAPVDGLPGTLILTLGTPAAPRVVSTGGTAP